MIRKTFFILMVEFFLYFIFCYKNHDIFRYFIENLLKIIVAKQLIVSLKVRTEQAMRTKE